MLQNLSYKKIIIVALLALFALLAFRLSANFDNLSQARLFNPDSYTKLVLIRDWQAAQGYQYMARDAAPYGSYLHWSMVHTWSVQQLAWALQGLGLAQANALLAAGAAITLVSVFMLCLFCLLTVLHLGGRLAALATLVYLLGANGLAAYGSPLQITHHIFMLTPLALALWLILTRDKHWSLAAGASLGLALWISPETMPFIVGIAALQVSLRLQQQRNYCWPMAVGLLGMLLAGWLIDPPPPSFSPWALDHISLSWLLWAVIMAVLLLLADWLAAWRRPSVTGKLLLLTGAALVGAALWLSLAPGALSGPAGLLPDELKTLWWSGIKELRHVSKPVDVLAYLLMPAIAGLALLYQAFKKRCLWWAALAGTTLAYTILTAWHIRMCAAASLAGALSWGVYLSQLDIFRDANPKNHPQTRQNQAAFLLLLPALVIVAMVATTYVQTKILNQGADKNPECDLADIATALRQKPAATVLLPLNDAPKLLWLTGHRVIAGNYHHNVQGILDYYHVMRSSADDQQAREIVAQRGINAILVCGLTASKSALLAARLARAEAVDWLGQPQAMGSWYWYPVPAN